MANPDDYPAILADLRTLATDQGWTGVTGLLADALAGGEGRSVMVLPGVDVDAGQLCDAVRTGGTRVTTRPLLDVASDADLALAADLALVVFWCGQLLSLEEGQAAHTVAQRPPG